MPTPKLPLHLGLVLLVATSVLLLGSASVSAPASTVAKATANDGGVVTIFPVWSARWTYPPDPMVHCGSQTSATTR